MPSGLYSLSVRCARVTPHWMPWIFPFLCIFTLFAPKSSITNGFFLSISHLTSWNFLFCLWMATHYCEKPRPCRADPSQAKPSHVMLNDHSYSTAEIASFRLYSFLFFTFHSCLSFRNRHLNSSSQGAEETKKNTFFSYSMSLWDFGKANKDRHRHTQSENTENCSDLKRTDMQTHTYTQKHHQIDWEVLQMWYNRNRFGFFIFTSLTVPLSYTCY